MTEYACTLDEATKAERLPADRALAAVVEEVERTATGAVVRARPGSDSAELVDTFIANESTCCGFFDLARVESETHVELHVDAPDDDVAQGLVDELVHVMRLGTDAFPVADVG